MIYTYQNLDDKNQANVERKFSNAINVNSKSILIQQSDGKPERQVLLPPEARLYSFLYRNIKSKVLVTMEVTKRRKKERKRGKKSRKKKLMLL